jgi:cobalt-zinc-cadmium efflux system membrane fusion protein
VTHGSDTVVFVEVAPGRFVRRVVIVRDDDGITATISAGLTAGERVVTTGSLLLAAEADRAQ